MRQPTVSVIVTNHNHAPTPRLCLESVAAQSYPHIETVDVDDGSGRPEHDQKGGAA